MSGKHITFANIDDEIGNGEEDEQAEQENLEQADQAENQQPTDDIQTQQLVVDVVKEEQQEEKDEEQREMRNMVRGLREKEIHDQFVIHEEKIQELMTDKKKMMLLTADLIVFKGKAEDIIGIELDSYIQFLIDSTLKKRGNYAFSFKVLKREFIKWLDHQYKERNKDPKVEEFEKQIEAQIQQEQQQQMLQKQEQINWRKKMSLDILKFKLNKHKDRLIETFKRHNSKKSMTVSQLAELFGDISYICGMVFCYYKEFASTKEYAGHKDSSEKFISSLQKYLWRYIHNSKLSNNNIMKGVLRQQSPEGYYEDRQQTQSKVRIEDMAFEEEKEHSSFDFSIFKKVLKMFAIEKNIVVVDLTSEYSKFLKKKDKEQGKLDLKQSLAKSINEYEQVIKQTEDEQQKQRLEKLIEQMRKELSKANAATSIFESATNAAQSLCLEQSFMSADMLQSNNNNIEDEKDNIINPKREAALKRIFRIYSKQHIAFRDATFDQFEDLSNRIILADFIKFCNDFQLWKDKGLTKEKINNIFFKAGSCHAPINYNQFLDSLQMIAIKINTIQIESEKKEIEELDKQLIKQQEEFKLREDEHIKFLSTKESQHHNYRKFSEEEKKQIKRKERELKDSKIQHEKTLLKLQQKSSATLLNELYTFMELDDKLAYSSKMKGFHLPFYIHDKLTRVPDDDPGNRYKVRNKKIPFSDVRKVVQEIRDKRERERMTELMKQNEKYLRKMKFIQKTHDRLRHEKLKKIVEERKQLQSQTSTDGQQRKGDSPNNNNKGSYLQSNPFNYLEIKNKAQGKPISDGRNLKVTLDILTKMHYQDFNQAGDQKNLFNPLDLIQQTYGSDDDTLSPSYLSQNDQDEEIELDEFTKKRMPKVEDFVTDQVNNKKKKKTGQKSSLVDDFQEKILSLKNQTTQPQNVLILESNNDNRNSQAKRYLTKSGVSKSVAQLHPIQNQQQALVYNKVQASYDQQLQQPGSLMMKNQSVINSMKQNPSLLRYEHNVPAQQLQNRNHHSNSINYPAQQHQQMMMRNASQQNILKASQLDLQNKNKMDGILKMHDRQIQKGMNVIRK